MTAAISDFYSQGHGGEPGSGPCRGKTSEPRVRAFPPGDAGTQSLSGVEVVDDDHSAPYILP